MSYPVWRAPRQRGFDPLSELYALRAELGRMVGSVLTGQRGTFADVDLEEVDDGWTVTARLPGVAPEEVAVEVDDRDLLIRARSEAEVTADNGDEGEGSHRRSFEYRMTIPSDVDSEQVDATMDHGLLVVHLPRSTRSRRRQIAVGRREAAAGIGGAQPSGRTSPSERTSPTGQAEGTETGTPVQRTDQTADEEGT
jgi:HSP20 family protein